MAAATKLARHRPVAEEVSPKKAKKASRKGCKFSAFKTPPDGRRTEPSFEEIERHLREGVIVKVEPILAGTGYWGLAESKFANAVTDENDPKRRKEMLARYEELAVQLKDVSCEERERSLLGEIAKWRRNAQNSSNLQPEKTMTAATKLAPHHPVPETAQYVQALTVIEDQITQNQREILAAHWSSPRRTSTASKLARAVGLKNYRAVNLLYGRLGKLLRQEMDYKLPGHTESYTISWFSHPSGSDIRFHMHPEIASALEQLGWVRSQGTPLNSAGKQPKSR